MSIELSKRAVSIIRAAVKKRAFTPRAVARLSYRDLILQDGCGVKTMYEIEEWLAWQGTTLRVMSRSLGAILADMDARSALPSSRIIEVLRPQLNSESADGVYAATLFIDTHPAPSSSTSTVAVAEKRKGVRKSGRITANPRRGSDCAAPDIG